MDKIAGRLADRFLEYYKRVREIHQQDTGSRLIEYKPTEGDRFEQVFQKILVSTAHGIEFLVEIMHSLVWSQCLGNANHRTTVLFMEGFLSTLEVKFPWYADEEDAENRFRVAVESYSDTSHRLLDRQSEFGYSPQRLKQMHKDHTRKWLERQLGIQSRVETMIDPHRLIAFSS